jgi:hypothetical protein
VLARRIAVIVLALLLAAQIVRNSAVTALAPLRPASAAKLWATHPAVEISLGLARIGKAARERRQIDASTFAMIDDAAPKAPLAPEPFLVAGVKDKTAGNLEAARRVFVAAQWRDPRSLPAAYFLADYYFRTGHVLGGLQETTLLARLSPGGVTAVAPFIASYAQNRANWPQMRALFRSQEGFENQVLSVLARDAANADAVLARTESTAARPARGSRPCSRAWSRAEIMLEPAQSGRRSAAARTATSSSTPASRRRDRRRRSTGRSLRRRSGLPSASRASGFM